MAAFIMLELILFPFLEKRSRLERGVVAKQAALRELIGLKSEYEHFNANASEVTAPLAKRDKNFSLFAHLEKLAADTGIKDHIKYMKPSSSDGSGPYVELSVEMKLVGISLEQLTHYLYYVEDTEKSIWIKRASIKAQKKPPRHLDVVLQVLTVTEQK